MTVKIYVGDCLERLQEFAAESVHCIVTSPPYYGLRSYMPDTVKLRDNLTVEERALVLTELERLGISPSSQD